MNDAPIFVGLFPKQTATAPDPLIPLGVMEVAAVSNCISAAPDDWIVQWKHNSLGFYDSEEIARSVIPSGAREPFDLYAYELFPMTYADELEPLAVEPAPGAVPADYEFLGYDIVSRSIATFFECSLLSCNLAAQEFGANRHCLITELAPAYEAFLKMGGSDAGYEPGPYFLFAVHRKRRGA